MPILKNGREYYPMGLTQVVRGGSRVITADNKPFIPAGSTGLGVQSTYYERSARRKSYFYLELRTAETA